MRTCPDRRSWSIPEAIFVVLAVGAGGCGSDARTPPTAPSPGPTFSLTGSVAETAPTEETAVAAASIRIRGGPDAGASATTDGSGRFAISSLRAATFTVDIQAGGYVEQFVTVTLDRDVRMDVHLDTAPQTVTTTIDDSITNGDGCPGYWDVPTLDNPCATNYIVNIHNAGPLLTTLTWNEPDASLGADLYDSNQGRPVGRATALDGRVSIALSAHSQYVIRVSKYSSGGGSAPAGTTPFKLTLTRPN
jgi:carboxypeptidase family protein